MLQGHHFLEVWVSVCHHKGIDLKQLARYCPRESPKPCCLLWCTCGPSKLPSHVDTFVIADYPNHKLVWLHQVHNNSPLAWECMGIKWNLNNLALYGHQKCVRFRDCWIMGWLFVCSTSAWWLYLIRWSDWNKLQIIEVSNYRGSWILSETLRSHRSHRCSSWTCEACQGMDTHVLGRDFPKEFPWILPVIPHLFFLTT